MKKLIDIYLNILNEQKSPTTFTPEQLLNDILNKCYFYSEQYLIYTFDQLKIFNDIKNKPLFNLLIKNINHKLDYSIIIIYYNDYKEFKKLISKFNYINPLTRFNQNPVKIETIFNNIEQYLEKTNKSGVNFNSIDYCPELGCIIGLNGKLIKSQRDFFKVLDHQINHYFEGLNLHFNLINSNTKINIHNNYDDIFKVLKEYYGNIFQQKDTFIQDLKYHLFDSKEFRSMCADVFHQILRYNQKHLKQLNFNKFIEDILNCNYKKYSIELQDYIIFCWICNKISISRWNILLEGIKEAISIKKNIFQKFFIKGKDWFRNLILKIN